MAPQRNRRARPRAVNPVSAATEAQRARVATPAARPTGSGRAGALCATANTGRARPDAAATPSAIAEAGPAARYAVAGPRLAGAGAGRPAALGTGPAAACQAAAIR